MLERGRVGISMLAALGVALAPVVAFTQQPSPPIAPAAPASTYRVAFNGSVAVGQSGWGYA